MKSFFSLRPLASFVIAVLIGAYSTSVLVQGKEGNVYPDEGDVTLSPELFNSAFSPSGSVGGEIIPASCSIGEPCDASDGICPCPAPSVSVSPTSANTVSGGYVNWSYSSVNAASCDLVTTKSATNVGPTYGFVGGATGNSYTAGPFANISGWVRYTVTCWNTGRSQSAQGSILINVAQTPKVSLLFGGSQSPFLNINSFSGPEYTVGSASLSWDVSGATSCTATGPSTWSGSSILLPTGSKIVPYSGTYSVIRTYMLTCTDGSESVSKSVTIEHEGSGEECGGATGKICY